MKALEDIKVDLVNSKWLSFNKVDIKENKMFEVLSKVLKPDEVVYSIVSGNILIEDKKLAKEIKKLAKLQKKYANSNKPVSQKDDDKMDKLANDLADPKEPGKAMIVMTEKRIITIYEDLNKTYKLRKLVKDVNDIEELNASQDSDDQGLFNFDISFGKTEVDLVTDEENNIKHFEFTLDQLIEIAAKQEIQKELEDK